MVHHSENPQAAFAENCSILMAGGQMYVAVSEASGRYTWLFRCPGALIRRGLRNRWTMPLVTLLAQVPCFLVHFVQSWGRRTWSCAQKLFREYFVTPRVTFLPHGVVEEWCAHEGVRVARYNESRVANVHSFCLVKHSHSKRLGDSRQPSAVEVLVERQRGAG